MKETVYNEVQQIHDTVATKMREVDDVLIYSALFGSQNYNMDNFDSDVDVHCMYAQHPKRIITNSNIHYPMVEGDFAYGGKADVKTVHDMLTQFRKGNLNFLELLWTPYIAVTPGWEWWVHYLRSNRQVFLEDRHHLFVTWGGFVRQMIARTTRRSAQRLMGPETASVSGWREDLGYNPKALANAMRIKETMIRFEFDGNFDRALWMGDYGELLKKVKAGCYTLDEVETILIELNTWLAKFLLVQDKEWEKQIKNQAYPSNAQILCDELEMEAFSRMWECFHDGRSYLKNLKI